jgi:hypothetical protein
VNLGSSDPDLPRFLFINSALIGPPLWFWAGYASGRTFAYLMHLSEDSNRPNLK